MPRIKDIAGQRFGSLTVLKDSGQRKSRNVVWLCKCDCGEECLKRKSNLNENSSCGCKTQSIINEHRTTHGMTGTRIYNIWKAIRQRTENPNHTEYSSYGARGIRVESEWQNFEAFWEWSKANGYSDSLTIDRINVNGNYCSNNCRWISNEEQQRNKTTNYLITFEGKTQTLIEWAEEKGINKNTLWARLNKLNWSVERALTEEVL